MLARVIFKRISSIEFFFFFSVLQSLQMMCWWAENPNGDEFKHHLARVPDYMWLAEDGMKMQVFIAQTLVAYLTSFFVKMVEVLLITINQIH